MKWHLQGVGIAIQTVVQLFGAVLGMVGRLGAIRSAQTRLDHKQVRHGVVQQLKRR